jgi:uncharacterized RDD family membrane protein YckC
MSETAPIDPPSALLLRRLLALLYDFWPVLALWLATAVPFVLLDAGMNNDLRHNIEPFSALAWLQWLACWAVAGLYATLSWRRGGQTLGMRPWRIAVVTLDGLPASRAALWARYAMATLSLLLCGAGFWWALLDRQGLTWHDRASNTRLELLPKSV